jgi:hypothetical protein
VSSFRTGPAQAQSGFFSIERVVAVLTPLFAAAAGLVTSAVGQLVPGVTLNKTDVTALFIAGATAAVGAALKWLHGRQVFMGLVHDSMLWSKEVEGLSGVGNIEKLLEQHKLDIVHAIENAVHAPLSVDQVVDAMVRRMGASRAGPAVPQAQGQGGAGTQS